MNVDANPSCNPDYIVNLEKDNLPFDDSSVDEVLAINILEHLGKGFFNCMKELYRVCRDGAIIKIAVPHPRHDTFLIDPTHRRPIYPETLNMFSRKHNLRDIMSNGNETPIAIINDVDFEMIAHRLHFDPYYEETFKTMTEEQINHILRTSNNVINTMEMILRVIKDDANV